MKIIAFLCVFAFFSCALALPLQSYTVTGSSYIYDMTKRVLDTANSRYFEEGVQISDNVWRYQMIVLPTKTYIKNINENGCTCRSQNFGYNDLVALWNNLNFVADYGTYSKYSGSIKDAPACSTGPTFAYTWMMNDSPSYPLNITYSSGSVQLSTHVTNSYSPFVDSGVFSVGSCCSTSTPIC